MTFLQKNYFCKLNQLTQKLHSIDRLSQGTSLQVLQKENEWKDKMAKMEKEFKVKEELVRSLETVAGSGGGGWWL